MWVAKERNSKAKKLGQFSFWMDNDERIDEGFCIKIRRL